MCRRLINKTLHLSPPLATNAALSPSREEADQRLRMPSEGEAGQINAEMEIKR